MDNEVQSCGGVSRRGLMATGGVSALGLLLAACGRQGRGPAASAPSGPPVDGGELLFGMNLDVSTLDPAFSYNFGDRYVLYSIFDTLVAYDTDFNIVPALAESWKTEGHNLVLQLRNGVKFHDGTDFNADAVKWNFDRTLNPKVNSPNRGLISPPLKSVTVEGDHTVRLNLEQQWRPLLAALGERPGFMVSPTAVEKMGDDFANNPVGTGAFSFVSWTQASQLKVERFADYWNKDKVHLDAITYKHVVDENTRLTMLRTGELHVSQDITAQSAITVQNDATVIVAEAESGKWSAVQMDTDYGVLQKTEVRQAIAYATNRAGVRDALYLGKARVATGPTGSGWAHDPKRTTPAFDYDLDKARELVTAAGAEGEELAWANSSSSDYQSVAQLVQEDYKKIGLTLIPSTIPDAGWYDDVMDNKVHFAVIDWTPRADVDGLLRILFHSKGGQNSTGYNNPKVDELLDKAAQILDTDEAAPLYREIEAILEKDAPYAWVVWPSYLFPYSNKVGGMQIYPDGVLRPREMWIST